MSWALMYYLLTVIDNLNKFSGVIFIGSIVIIVISLFSLLPMLDFKIDNEYKQYKSNVYSLCKRLFICTIMSAIGLTFIPNKKDIIIIAGLKIGESPVKQVVSDTYPMLKALIDKELKELVGTVKKDK